MGCAQENRKAPAMLNFICHLDWATERLDIQSNAILGVPARIFLDEINI